MQRPKPLGLGRRARSKDARARARLHHIGRFGGSHHSIVGFTQTTAFADLPGRRGLKDRTRAAILNGKVTPLASPLHPRNWFKTRVHCARQGNGTSHVGRPWPWPTVRSARLRFNLCHRHEGLVQIAHRTVSNGTSAIHLC